MASLINLYAQSLDVATPPQDTENSAVFQEKVQRLANQISCADAIVVGIGSGLSTASGYDFYHKSPRFDEEFATFEQAHGFETLFDGLFHVFGSNEEQWAFNAAVAEYIRKLPVGKPYKDLEKAFAGSDYFVITTNVDGQAARAFPEDRVFLFQGDLRYWQCSQPCCEQILDNEHLAQRIRNTTFLDERGIPRADAELLPRRSECGHLMTPWIRDINFLEGNLWHEQEERYLEFLRKHLEVRKDKVLFLELGVSSMTPAIIKFPFWSMCDKNPQTEYVCVNKGEASTPKHLGSRASVITSDLSPAISALEKALSRDR